MYEFLLTFFPQVSVLMLGISNYVSSIKQFYFETILKHVNMSSFWNKMNIVRKILMSEMKIYNSFTEHCEVIKLSCRLFIFSKQIIDINILDFDKMKKTSL